MTEKQEAASWLLDREVPEDLLRERTAHLALRKSVADVGTKSIVVFRIGAEWFGLATEVFQEVTEECAIHTLPHRRGGILAGLANVRGELLLCVSLERLLGVEPDSTSKLRSRVLVCDRKGDRLAFPVTEMAGVHRYSPGDLRAVPATLANGDAGVYTFGMLPWQGRSVACLDDELVFYGLNKGFA